MIRHRETLGGLNSFTNNLGTLLGLCLGLVVPVQFYAFPLCCPSLVFLLLCWLLPESPVWLMRNNREREARRTLAWLRGHSYDIEPEITEIEEVIAEEEKNSQHSVVEVIKRRSFLQPLALTCTLSIVQLLSGSDMMETYILVIFKDTGVTPKHLAIIYQV